MKKTLYGLIAAMGGNLSAAAQEIKESPKFWQTLSNQQRVLVDCSLLSARQKTMAFIAQYEPYTPEQINALSPQQQVWLRMSRESRSTDLNLINNLEGHLNSAHGIKRGEVDAAYRHCVTLDK